ncbi:bifunctional proline dehydrogenase/pyrroline-5-carboxylate dehydrogenase [Escherichia coli]|nr:bifunctional proline dehydrogenase/pyrroline-5-carboxylate dehydrogenase [Escherichia coli]
MAMRLMGEQFVPGETLPEALAHARIREKKGFGYSYVVHGHATRTIAESTRITGFV